MIDKTKSDFIRIPAPRSWAKTTTGSTAKTLAEIPVNFQLLEEGARAQLWTANLMIIAIAVFALSKLHDVLTHRYRPPPLPFRPDQNTHARH